MKPLVLYHFPCWDGYGAAWAAWRALGNAAEYRPVRHADHFPEDVGGRDVYILDFSWPPADIAPAINGDNPPAKITIIDHHASALRQWQDVIKIPLIWTKFNVDHSGAVLAWQHFHEEMVPNLLRYIEDRDLWRFALPKTAEVQSWLRSWPCTFEGWDVLKKDLDTHFDQVVAEGTSILRFQMEQVRSMADEVNWKDIGGYWVPYANATVFYSDVGQELCNRFPAAAFAAYYRVRSDGKREWGLRATGQTNVDVSLVAQQYGGGGHPQSAGFIEDLRDS